MSLNEHYCTDGRRHCTLEICSECYPMCMLQLVRDNFVFVDDIY